MEGSQHVTPSGAIIDPTTCAAAGCGEPSVMIVGVYIGVGPIEIPCCAKHAAELQDQLEADAELSHLC